MKPSDLVSVYGEIAEIIGVENTFKIYEHFKGQQLNCPMRIISATYIEAYVKTHYDGTNLRELAKQFNYSERRIRQLLNSEGTDKDELL